MESVRARQVAVLACSALLVIVAVQTSDVATVRLRELSHLRGFEYPVLARLLYIGERLIWSSRRGIAIVNAAVAILAAAVLARVLRKAGAVQLEAWIAAPTLILVAVNVDGVTALTIGMAAWFWRRGRLELAGLVCGLGAALKLAPGLLLVPLVASEGWRRGGRALATALGAWVAVNLSYALTRPHEWWFPYRFAAQRTDHEGTIWAALPLDHHAVNLASALAILAAAVAVFVAVRRGALDPRRALALLLLAFLVTSKLWQPHYLLWLLPVLALWGAPRRPLLALELANLAYFLVLWLQLSPGTSGPWLWLSGGARLAAACWLAVGLLVQPLASASPPWAEDAPEAGIQRDP